ncbi:DUF294 nucleotidyltransferase-like domain-containing protein [Thiomicrorhabdus sediminis]|uniref:CBS domain-containing protein n=1 Tax=Thiomicrorhabdus sediminis TaxID=2580412 RepID=A0A4P9K7Q9_9GAMM|nr:DUF294 nucleotidyltransferase-like domain-containing protein [Thiomicrorhabdus sediminis]QCU90277.1 CBS domain-containing protein [Thiomicrorhabdus sediminis]
MAQAQQRDFLSQITPFDELPQADLYKLADSMDVSYFPEHSKIDLTSSAHGGYLYIIIKGKVAEIRDGAIISHYSVRGFFGDAEIFAKADKKVFYEVLEETIAYKMPAAIFLKNLEGHAKFSGFFNTSIVDKLNRVHQTMQAAASTEMMMNTVCNAPIQKHVSVKEQATILQVSQKMLAVRSDACLVEYDDGSVGIVTNADILRMVACEPHGLLTEPGVVGKIANKPVHSVHEFDYLFNALLKMTRYQIDRLVVRRDDGFAGFLHQKDLMTLFANQPGLVLLKVEKVESIDDLVVIGPQIDELINSLNRKGIKTHYIAKLVNELHRKMIHKLIEILLPQVLQDEVCIFVMGSEGRSEQVIRTDQDNALVYSDDLAADQLSLLDQFAADFTAAMQKIGFPPCPGNIMLSNPEWRMSISDFKLKVENWFKNPSDTNFMYAAILLDGEAVYGQHEWLTEIKQTLRQKQEDYPVFLRHFAVGALQFNTPVGFFGGLQADSGKDREQNLIDIKKGGIFPIVHGVRCYALEAGIEQTNTHWRIKALMDRGIFKQEFGIELGETLNYLNTLRLESMLAQVAEGVEIPDNKVRLASLNHRQQDILKQSFAVVDVFKKRIVQHFKLESMM